MCGIVALYNTDLSAVDPDLLVSMRDRIRHRGPDDAGLRIEGHVGLGHRRLSIIDLSAGAKQPMCDESGRVWISFNGEIYNFKDLRSECEARGYRFRTKSDTETILAAYVLDGETFVTRLNGIFSFALWDSGRQRLYLVRDRLGVKPLYVWRRDGIVAAASEIKALLEHPRIQPEVDADLVPEYLAFRQMSGTKTLLKGIEQVAPGTMLVVDRAGERTVTYWSQPVCVTPDQADETTHLARVEELLQDAARMQMVSDVPLGTFNSGGIDSSLITAYVAETAAGGLNTFSVGFDDPRFDERPYAEMVARKYGTNHRTLVIQNHEYSDQLPHVVWYHDEPLSHPHTVQLYLLSRFARQFVTVVLTGEGSDELFAGYPRYRAGAMLQRLGPLGRWLGGSLARRLPPGSSRWEKARRALAVGPLGNVVQAPRWVGDGDLQRVLALDASPIRPERLPTYPLNGDWVARMLEQDQRNYLHVLLMRLDKTTMAASLEARVPFLDHRLVELAARVPTSLKLKGLENKYLIKKLAVRRLPESLVYRRKMGFPVPLSEWFRDPVGLGRYLELLLEPRSLDRGYFQSEQVKRVVAEHRAGSHDHRELLWGLVNLELWHRTVVERRQEPATALTTSARAIPASAEPAGSRA
jgi:asparagine synthase (glutamine-hydrolysing)